MEYETILAVRCRDLESEYCLFQVERETPDRVYGRQISEKYVSFVMGGYKTGHYIEKKYVIARNVTPELSANIIDFIQSQEQQVRKIWNEFRLMKDSRLEKILEFIKENQ